MEIKNRIKSLEFIKAKDLVPNVKNWRVHPDDQKDALRGILAQVGMAGAILARRDAEGRLVIIDGHMRAETLPDADLPVLVTDLTEEEADFVLATHDNIGTMAKPDLKKLKDLNKSIVIKNDAVKMMVETAARIVPKDFAPSPAQKGPVEHLFTKKVTCEKCGHVMELGKKET